MTNSSASLSRFIAPSEHASGGSGLGLAIARGFVEANGGRLRAESQPGQGSTFVFQLPVPSEARIARAGRRGAG